MSFVGLEEMAPWVIWSKEEMTFEEWREQLLNEVPIWVEHEKQYGEDAIEAERALYRKYKDGI